MSAKKNSVLFSDEVAATKPRWFQEQFARLKEEMAAQGNPVAGNAPVPATLPETRPLTPCPPPRAQDGANAPAKSPNTDGTHPAHDSSPRPQPQQAVQPARNRKVPRKTEDVPRFLVRVTSFRCRLLDEDNLCPKYFVDACRHAGIIPEDDPGTTHIETRQTRVPTRKEERTEIVIEALPPTP